MPYVALAHAGRVHYAERGERRPGRPSAVLIHGAGASSAIWMMVLARVARGGHAIAIDLPGHGPSAADGHGARRRARADAGALPRRRRRAGGHAVPRPVGAGRPFAGRAGRDRGGAGLARQGAGLVLCAAAPRLPVDPELARAAARRPARASSAGSRSTRCRRARKPAIRRGFLAAGDVDARRSHARRLRHRPRHRPRRAHRRARLPGHLARRRGRSHRAARPTDARAQIVTLPDVGHLTPIEAPASVHRRQVADVGQRDDRAGPVGRGGHDAVVGAVEPGRRAAERADARAEVGVAHDREVGARDVGRRDVARRQEAAADRRLRARRQRVRREPGRHGGRSSRSSRSSSGSTGRRGAAAHSTRPRTLSGHASAASIATSAPIECPTSSDGPRQSVPASSPTASGSGPASARANRRAPSLRRCWARAPADRSRPRARRAPPGPAPSSRSPTTRRRRESAPRRDARHGARRAQRSERARRGRGRRKASRTPHPNPLPAERGEGIQIRSVSL